MNGSVEDAQESDVGIITIYHAGTLYSKLTAVAACIFLYYFSNSKVASYTYIHI